MGCCRDDGRRIWRLRLQARGVCRFPGGRMRWEYELSSVQADEVGIALFGPESALDGLRLLAVVALGTDADPVAGWSFEIDDLGVGEGALELVAQLFCLS